MGGRWQGRRVTAGGLSPVPKEVKNRLVVTLVRQSIKGSVMRAEIETMASEIKQSLELLRGHL